jgi:hypothetical protein
MVESLEPYGQPNERIKSNSHGRDKVPHNKWGNFVFCQQNISGIS